MYNINDYQTEIAKFLNPKILEGPEVRLSHACIGLSGESGELLEHIKKWLFFDKDLELDAVTKELGDCAFYLVEVASALNLNMSDVLEGNIDKLSKRYPTGAWDAEDSKMKRDEDAVG